MTAWNLTSTICGTALRSLTAVSFTDEQPDGQEEISLTLHLDITATFNNDRDEYLQKYLLGEVDADTLLDYWASHWEKAVADQGKLWE